MTVVAGVIIVICGVGRHGQTVRHFQHLEAIRPRRKLGSVPKADIAEEGEVQATEAWTRNHSIGLGYTYDFV